MTDTDTSTTPPDAAAEDRFRKLANAYQISCAVNAAARLRLYENLDHAPVPANILAERVGASAGPFRRLLDFLAQLGVVRINSSAHVSQTDLTPLLASVDSIAEGDHAVDAWQALPEALKTNKTPFEVAHGAPFYAVAKNNDARAAAWIDRNRRIAARWAGPVADALPLRAGARIADLGAGNLALARAVARRQNDADIIVADLPFVIEELGGADRSPLDDRHISLLPCNLLEDPIPEADAFTLSRVLLNFGDKDVIAILQKCRQSLREDGRIFIAETLMPAPDDPRRAFQAAHDLHLHVLWGSKQRTFEAFAELITEAGLAPTETIDVFDQGQSLCTVVVAGHR
ncbi:MAG: methyltransferase [Pseudomonadota bacterium]